MAATADISQKILVLEQRCIKLFQRGELDTALNSFEELLALDANRAASHNGLGIVLSALDRSEDAISHFRQAIAIDGRYVEAYVNLGALLRKTGALDESVEILRRAVELNAKSVQTQSYLGKSLFDLRKLDEAIACFQKALDLNDRHIPSLHALGDIFRQRGMHGEAIRCFQRAIEIQPEDALAHHNAGVLLKEDDREKATRHLEEALRLNPDNVMTQHELAAVRGLTTDSMPEDYVVNLFDHYAAGFDEHLLQQLDYQAPVLIAEALKSTGQTRFERALDLGCGTGLVGQVLRPMVGHMTGIDLSPEMVASAKEKGTYDDLHVADICEVLKQDTTVYDLFVAGDVFVYVGDLRAIIAAVSSRIAEAGWFTFSVEHTEQYPFELKVSGRYGHHQRYVEELAAEFDFKVHHRQSARLRKERSGWIEGDIYLLKPDFVNDMRGPSSNADEPDARDCSPLFLLLEQGRVSSDEVRKQLAAGEVVEPREIEAPPSSTKMLTQYANARLVQNAFRRCKTLCNRPKEDELVVEIGAGDGHLRHLLRLPLGDPSAAKLTERLISCEPDGAVVRSNATRGHYMLRLGIQDLISHFGKQFADCVIGINVLDLFARDELAGHLNSLGDLIKPGGVLLHIMLASGHPQVFRQVAREYPGMVLAPYQRDGRIGLRALSKHEARGVHGATGSAEELCRIYASDSARFFEIANRVSALKTTKEHTTVFVDYFKTKMSRYLPESGFQLLIDKELAYNETVAEPSQDEANRFVNMFGTLFADHDPKIRPKKQIQSVTGLLTIAQRRP